MGLGNQAGFIKITESGKMESFRREPLVGLVESGDAAFENPGEMGGEMLPPKVAAASDPALAALPLLRIGQAMGTRALGMNPAMGAKMKARSFLVERRAAVKTLTDLAPPPEEGRAEHAAIRPKGPGLSKAQSVVFTDPSAWLV
jgi:hypothetical protein